MKKTNYVIKLISALLFAAIAIYIGVSAIRYYTNPYSTTTAIYVTTGVTVEAKGFIVRAETVITTDEPCIRVSVSEGEKVGVGGAVAISYPTESAREVNARIDALELAIEQLTAYVNEGQRSEEAMTLDASVKSSILEMNYSLSQGDLLELSETSVILRSLVFSSSEEDALTRLDTLQNELRSLQGEADAGSDVIAAEVSGLFSSNVDGFESVTPGQLSDMTASEATALMESGISESDALGKLVTGTDWYFVTVLSQSDAARLSEIEDAVTDEDPIPTVSSELSGISSGSINMTIERVGEAENGSVIAVLSSNRFMGDTLWNRMTDISMTFNSESGIRVPKEAVYTDEEGKTYIYTEKALQAELRYVDIVTEYGNYYLVESSEGEVITLREGDEIIVTAKDLYDGKVIEQ